MILIHVYCYNVTVNIDHVILLKWPLDVVLTDSLVFLDLS